MNSAQGRHAMLTTNTVNVFLLIRYTSEYGSVPGETDPEVESDTVKLKAIFTKLCTEAGLHPPPGQVIRRVFPSLFLCLYPRFSGTCAYT